LNHLLKSEAKRLNVNIKENDIPDPDAVAHAILAAMSKLGNQAVSTPESRKMIAEAATEIRYDVA